MRALEVQPFSTVEDKGFRGFVYSLGSRYELPARNTILNIHLKLMYYEMANKLRKYRETANIQELWRNTSRSDAIISLRHYAEKPIENITTDPLEYWKTRSSDMKEMQILASKYLCIPATSTELERMFSKAAQVV
ncbi:hypothetical protein DOY81_007006 [Sarcophaga bullata]|nr:hypothetical protein DOY81_007006 [Sarcophaga bullata]